MTNLLIDINKMIGKQLSLLSKTYDRFSIWGKILFFASLVIASMVLLKRFELKREGFEQSDKFLFKSGPPLMRYMQKVQNLGLLFYRDYKVSHRALTMIL